MSTQETCTTPVSAGAALRATLPQFWKNLTRKLTQSNALNIVSDDKVEDRTPRIYAPSNLVGPLSEYLGQSQVEVEVLSDNITPAYVNSLFKRPGLLAGAFSKDGVPLPYIVPGSRFNEIYGWDSYFITLGLLQDGLLELAKDMVRHLSFEVRNYGKILNATRTYFLGRSQPPFLTDMARQVYAATGDVKLLEEAISAAITEYYQVWTGPARLDVSTGLSKYSPPAVPGIPPETEPGHFDEVLRHFAGKLNISIAELESQYNSGTLNHPELDAYFVQDQGVRESGHDTTTRFHNVCADLVTIDLNTLLYKYETDIAWALSVMPAQFSREDPETWLKRAAARKRAVNEFCWNAQDGMFYDYNTVTNSQNKVPSATMFWSLWSGLASDEQVEQMVENALPLLEMPGGLASTAKPTALALARPRQWDYPFGWAPHQILAWVGFTRFRREDIAARLASKWIKMVVDVYEQRGSIFEKYNVANIVDGGEVSAEYGNQGNANEGFGWTNASVSIGWDKFMRL